MTPNMEIVILRHGKPDISVSDKLRACEMREWIESYDSADIDQTHVPPVIALEKAAQCNVVVCSDLKRSVESAGTLKAGHVYLSDAVFREFSLPYMTWHSFRLPPMIWAAFFRMLWFAGFSAGGESFRASRLRVKRGSDKLNEVAAEHGSVLFVGHGLYNCFLAKELLSTGWQGPTTPGKRYWEFGVYTHAIR